MSRTKERETIVTLLYTKSMEGGYGEADHPDELLATFRAVLAKLPEIDRIISENLVDWTIDRLNKVDLAILRYAVYELAYTDEFHEVIIDQAIELTKKYTNLDDNKQKAFNNKLLDTIKNKIRK
ncbi:MAG: transcription antitermination protein NusB [Candidatus Izemoplasmatales bacterium]